MKPNKWKAKDLDGEEVIGYPILICVLQLNQNDTPPYYTSEDISYFQMAVCDFNYDNIAVSGFGITAFNPRFINIQQDTLEEIKENE